MSAETQLYSTMTAAAGVTALVGQRVYPDVIPQESDLPAIAYQRTGTEFQNTIHGGSPLGQTTTLEIMCVAETRHGANGLAQAVVAALAGTDFSAIDQQAAADLASGEAGLWGAIVIVNINS